MLSNYLLDCITDIQAIKTSIKIGIHEAENFHSCKEKHQKNLKNSPQNGREYLSKIHLI